MSKRVCYLCGKSPMAAVTRKHHRGVASKKFQNRAQATKKVLQVNLHRTTIIEKGRKKKVLLCTKCLRKAKKARSGKASNA